MKSCKYEITGVVKEIKDENGLRLYIESKDNKIFYPQIEQDNIVIASGAKVQVCYDAVKTLADNQVQIRISDVVYLP